MSHMEEMTPQRVNPPSSGAFNVLVEHFNQMQRPYSAEEIRSFNQIYRKIYRNLSKSDRLVAEGIVDQLISGAEKPEHAALIYGVF